MGVANWFMHLWCNGDTMSAKKQTSSKISCVGEDFYHPKESGFQMPLNYPRFNRSDYEKMDAGMLKLLLAEYGLKFEGGLDELRAYAIGTFLWPDQP